MYLSRNPLFITALCCLMIIAMPLCVSARQLVLQMGAVSEFFPKGYDGVEEAQVVTGVSDSRIEGPEDIWIGSNAEGAHGTMVIVWRLDALRELFSSKGYLVTSVKMQLGEFYTSDYTSREYQAFQVGGRDALAGFSSDTRRDWRARDVGAMSLPVDLVRSWALDPESNTGLIIKAKDEKTTGYVSIVASKSTRQDLDRPQQRPRLVITYFDLGKQSAISSKLLAKSGATNRIIVCPSNPTQSEEFAASELASHLESITGAEFPICPENIYTSAFGPAISVGRTLLSSKVLSDSEFGKLGDEGYALRNVGNVPVIVGGTKRGTLYGVYDYLESLGVRWFTEDETKIPQLNVVNAKISPKTHIPDFEYRDMAWGQAYGSNTVTRPEWFARMRLNGSHARIPDTMGGCNGIYWNGHNMSELAPPVLFDKHPEYFAMKEDGVRSKPFPGSAEVCLTNPEIREYVLEVIRSHLRSWPLLAEYWVAQDDGSANGCFCDKCLAERVAHGGKDKWSANMISFVNYLGRGIKKEFPNVKLRTFAYSYTNLPPTELRVEDNVKVVVCGGYGEAFDANNSSTLWDGMIRSWCKSAKNVQLYIYAASNYIFWMPYPNYYALADNHKLALRDGIKNIYSQGNTYAGMLEMRTYINARMTWYPHGDIYRDMDEFCKFYYGPAAKPIMEYLDYWRNYIAKNKVDYSRCGWGENEPFLGWCTTRNLAASDGFFQRALRATDKSPKYHKRVRAAYLEVLYPQVMLRVAKGQKNWDVGRESLVKWAKLFGEIMAENGYSQIGETKDFKPEANPLYAAVTDLKTYRLGSNDNYVIVSPTLGGRLTNWTTPVFNANLFKTEPNDPYSGGYEEYSQFGRSGTDTMAAYSVVESNDSSIRMSASLDNGLAVVRTIGYMPDNSCLSIESILRNTTDRELTVTPRTHPEFDLALFTKARVYVPGADGSTCARDIDTSAVGEGSIQLPADTASLSTWTIGDLVHNRGLIGEFDPKTVSNLYAWWGLSSRVLTWELWGRPVKLAPGESSTFKHSLRVTGDLNGWLTKH